MIYYKYSKGKEKEKKMVKKMTSREFYEKVSLLENEELQAYALEQIEKMDKKLVASRAKAQAENGPIIAIVNEALTDPDTLITATTLGALANVSHQKASSVLVGLEKNGILKSEPKSIDGRFVKHYSRVESEEG